MIIVNAHNKIPANDRSKNNEIILNRNSTKY
jgi:hypothetical protein